MTSPLHPGLYIREHVIPSAMPVKEAAKLLGVGRPALSNLLNGNAALSPEMAARLEKAFGADQQKLLKLQAEFDQHQQNSIAQKLVVGTYVPPFLKITAKEIEHWADGNLEARSLLPVLLRKLVNSTGQDLSLVDFPGYDQAEKKGWDGSVDAGAATPWIPMGKSGWEFGSEMRTPAMQAGLEKRRLSFRDIFSASSLFWLLGKIRFAFNYCSSSVQVHDLRFLKAA